VTGTVATAARPSPGPESPVTESRDDGQSPPRRHAVTDRDEHDSDFLPPGGSGERPGCGPGLSVCPGLPRPGPLDRARRPGPSAACGRRAPVSPGLEQLEPEATVRVRVRIQVPTDSRHPPPPGRIGTRIPAVRVRHGLPCLTSSWVPLHSVCSRPPALPHCAPCHWCSQADSECDRA
jgi:hypothetical protein